MILINFKHMQVLSEILFVLAVSTSSSNTTSSNTPSTANTTQGKSPVPSVSSVTGVNETTGEGSHGSTGDVYIFAILTNKIDVYKFQAYSNTNAFCFVLPALAASSNSTVSNVLDSVNTTQTISTITSINSTTGVTDSTGEASHCSTGVVSQDRIDKGFHGSTGEGYQGSTSDIYTDAFSTIKMFPINFRHIEMFS